MNTKKIGKIGLTGLIAIFLIAIFMFSNVALAVTATNQVEETSTNSTNNTQGEQNTTSSNTTSENESGSTNQTITQNTTTNSGQATRTQETESQNQRTEATQTNTQSSNANLSNLGIRPNDFTGFTPSKTEYDVTVPEDVESVEIYATAQSSSARISGIGTEELNYGLNEFTITVTAQDGTTKNYILNVTRGGEVENTENVQDQYSGDGLASLNVAGLELSPSFDTIVYEYSVKYIGEETSLDITAEATDPYYTVEITGNEDLQEGENLITILVSDPDGENVATYQVTINKSLVDEEALAREQAEKDRQRNIIIGVLVAVVVIAIIIIVVVKRRRKNEFAGEYTVPYQGLNKDISDLDDDVRDEYDEDDLPKSLKNNNLNDVNEDDEKYKNNIEDLYKNQNDGKTIEEVEAESETKKSRKIRRKGKRYLD